MIRSKALRKLIFSLPFFLAFAFLVYALQSNGLLSSQGFLTPYSLMKPSQIDDILNKPLGKSMIRVSLDAAEGDWGDIGIEETEDDKPTGYFLAAYLGGKYIICRISPSQYNALPDGGGYTFVGTMSIIGDDVMNLVLKSMADQGITESEARNLLCDYGIDTGESGIPSRLTLYFFTLIWCAAGVILLVRGVRPLFNPLYFPSIQKLAVNGSADYTLHEISRQLDIVSSESSIKMRSGCYRAYLLSNWILLDSPMNIRFVSAGDLIWVYKEKSISKYGRLVAGVSYFARLMTRKGIETAFGNDIAVDRLIASIAEKYPHVTVGFTQELECKWNTSLEQFVEFAISNKAGSK